MSRITATNLIVLLLLFISPYRADGSSPINDAPDPATQRASIEYIALSDSIINNRLIEGDELARVLLNRGAIFFEIGRPVKAMQALKEVREHSNDANILGDTDLRIGDIYFEQRSYSRALEHYATALRFFEKTDNRKSMANARFKTAAIHHKRGDDEMAEALLKAVIADAFVDDLRRAHAHETLGQVYYRVAEFDSCRVHLKKANVLYGSYGMNEERLENYERIMQSYLDEGEFTMAREAALEAANLAIEEDHPERTAFFLMRIAALFASAGDYRQATSYQEMAVSGVDALSAGQAVDAYLKMGLYYGKIGRDADALLAMHEGERIARAQNDDLALERAARSKMDFFSSRDRHQEAFAALRLADSLAILNFVQLTTTLKRELSQGKFREEAYVRTDFDLRTAREEQQLANMRNAVIIGIIFFSIVIILLLREFGQKRKLSKVLEWKVYKRTRELRKANKELNTYIYKSSHDLRTPLTSIKSLLRLLEKEDHSMSTRKYLGLVEACTEQMDDILINLSRAVDYKKVDVKVEQIDFNKLRYQIHEKELVHVRDVNVDWDIQEAGPFYSDFKLIKVILQQTIANAIAYRKGTEDDYCKVSIYTEPSGATITIEDNGQGIPEKVRDKVFDMFVKGTHKSTGAGLGLYLVRIAVDKIRAKVRLESEENEGSTFSFELPNLN